MLLPDKAGVFHCRDCEYTTDNVFELFQHCDIDFTWEVYMGGRYSFDLFQFLELLDELIADDSGDTARDYIQTLSLGFANIFEGGMDLNEFFQESLVRKNVNTVIKKMEDMLKDEHEQR
jgi:hypothetical protein